MTLFKQIGAVALINIQSIPQRIGASLVIVLGIAGVVAVLISVLAMASGFMQTVAKTGRADRVIVIRGGSQSESTSTLSRESAQTIMDAPGLRHGSDGKVIASAETLVIFGVIKKSDGLGANVALRGIGPQALTVRPEIKLTAGRMFSPAVRELIVGKSAAAQFKNLEVGDHIAFRGGDWTVVGQFESGGDSHESELFADAETVLSAVRRNLFQLVTGLLESPADFDRFKAALTTNPALSVDVLREPDYYAKQSEQLTKLLFFVAYFVGSIMAIGALFGALNTMYSAVSARSQEIATLRAIGFGAVPVVVSVFVEALLLALLGGVLGAAIAWLFFNGNTVNTLGGNFTQVVFHLAVSPQLALLGVIWACVIGLLGGLFPAVRAARLPIATALRAA
jgi:putative ABC transport system permease protein